MDLVDELGNDLAFAALLDESDGKKIDSKDILPLLNKIREVLEPLSARDHSSLPLEETFDEAGNPLVSNLLSNETTNSH